MRDVGQADSDMSAPVIEEEFDVLVVGAGAAGIGVGVALKYAGIENIVVIDRLTIGASFAAWPAETRFITPSFPTNSVGMIDLNAIAIGSSPGFTLGVEHPTGKEYAKHLEGVAGYFKVPICENTEITKIAPADEGFRVYARGGSVRAKHVIWAGGEFQYPRRDGLEGIESCRHTALTPSYQELEGDDFIVIGGYESGVDAAYHLAGRGKRVKLFDSRCPWEDESSEPSLALSPYSRERMRSPQFREFVQTYPNTAVASVECGENGYRVITADGAAFETSVPPLLAHGFEGSHKLIADLFEKRDDGFPLLSENDESTITPGVFLCGPSVRHDDFIFCFIYKYRQRFAVVAKAIANSLGLPAPGLEAYREVGMYLDDLSCCGEECVC